MNKNAIDQNIEALLKSLHPDQGQIILSGLLLDDWAWVQQRMTTFGLKLVDKRACIVACPALENVTCRYERYILHWNTHCFTQYAEFGPCSGKSEI